MEPTVERPFQAAMPAFERAFRVAQADSLRAIIGTGGIMLDKQVLQLIEQYVAGEIPFVDFSQRFAGLYFAVRQGRNVPRQAS